MSVDTPAGVGTIKSVCFPCESGSTQEGKNLLLRSKSFPLRVDPFFKGA